MSLCDDSDGWGPLTQSGDDLSACFQGLVLFPLPTLWMICAGARRVCRIYHEPLDEASSPVRRRIRFMAVIFIICLKFATLVYNALTENRDYLYVSVGIQSFGWLLSLWVMMMENVRGLGNGYANRGFWVGEFLVALKASESVAVRLIANDKYATALIVLVVGVLAFNFRMLLFGLSTKANKRPTFRSKSFEESFLKFNYHGSVNRNLDASVNSSGWSSMFNAGRHDRKSGPAGQSGGGEGRKAMLESVNSEKMQQYGLSPYLSPEAVMLASCALTAPRTRTVSVRESETVEFEIHVEMGADAGIQDYTVFKNFRQCCNLAETLETVARQQGLVVTHLNRNRYNRKQYNAAREALELFLKTIVKQPLYWPDVAEFVDLISVLRKKEMAEEFQKHSSTHADGKQSRGGQVESGLSERNTADDTFVDADKNHNIINIFVTGSKLPQGRPANVPINPIFLIVVQTDVSGRWVVERSFMDLMALEYRLSLMFTGFPSLGLDQAEMENSSKESVREAQSTVEIFLQKLLNTHRFQCAELALFFSQEVTSTIDVSTEGFMSTPNNSQHTSTSGSANTSGMQHHLQMPPSSSSSSSSTDTKYRTVRSVQPDRGDFHRYSVSIDEWLFDTADPQNVVYYIIKVREFFTASDYLEWVVYRRYSEFVSLQKRLTIEFEGRHLPSLPPKSWFGGASVTFLQKRQQGLESYLQQIINTSAFQTESYHEFFDLSNPSRKIAVGQTGIR